MRATSVSVETEYQRLIVGQARELERAVATPPARS